MAKRKKDDDTIKLSREEFNQFIMDLENFEHGFMSILAGSEDYEIIQLPKEGISAQTAKKLKEHVEECREQEIRVIYQIPNGKTELYICPDNISTIGVAQVEGMSEDLLC